MKFPSSIFIAPPGVNSVMAPPQDLVIFPRLSRRGGNQEPWLCADTVMATNIRQVDGGIAPSAFPSAQPSLHTTRVLDSRCDEKDGVGAPGFSLRLE